MMKAVSRTTKATVFVGGEKATRITTIATEATTIETEATSTVLATTSTTATTQQQGEHG